MHLGSCNVVWQEQAHGGQGRVGRAQWVPEGAAFLLVKQNVPQIHPLLGNN